MEHICFCSSCDWVLLELCSSCARVLLGFCSGCAWVLLEFWSSSARVLIIWVHSMPNDIVKEKVVTNLHDSSMNQMFHMKKKKKMLIESWSAKGLTLLELLKLRTLWLVINSSCIKVQLWRKVCHPTVKFGLKNGKYCTSAFSFKPNYLVCLINSK